jgi:hypothetical protein
MRGVLYCTVPVGQFHFKLMLLQPSRCTLFMPVKVLVQHNLGSKCLHNGLHNHLHFANLTGLPDIGSANQCYTRGGKATAALLYQGMPCLLLHLATLQHKGTHRHPTDCVDMQREQQEQLPTVCC